MIEADIDLNTRRCVPSTCNQRCPGCLGNECMASADGNENKIRLLRWHRFDDADSLCVGLRTGGLIDRQLSGKVY